MTIIEPVPVEENCEMPTYKPGDVVLVKAGGIGVITDAHVGNRKWNTRDIRYTPKMDGIPRYSLDSIPGLPRPDKCAWFTSVEFKAVALGPLHFVKDFVPQDRLSRDNDSPQISET